MTKVRSGNANASAVGKVSAQPVNTVLVVGDAKLASDLGSLLIPEAGWRVVHARDLRAAAQVTPPPAICVLEVGLLAASVRWPGALVPVPRVVLLPRPTSEAVATAINAGAAAVLPWPVDAALVARSVEDEARRWPVAASRLPPVPPLAGSSAALQDTWRMLLLAARSDAPLLVEGETGSGKDLLVAVVHRLSGRRSGPLRVVRAGAVADPGPRDAWPWEQRDEAHNAQPGTLVLDEVADLSPAGQAALLGWLETTGGTDAASPSRVVATTQRELADDVARGRFRADLLHRLGVLSARVPPLRQRRDEILPLWDTFLAATAAEDRRAVPRTTPETSRLLLRHPWPGNVRELANVARRALAVCAAGEVVPADLPPALQEARGSRMDVDSLVGMPMADVERALIMRTYEAAGTVETTAKILGISPRTIHYRLREYRTAGGPSAVPRPRVQRPLPAVAPTTVVAPTAARVLLAEDDDDVRWALEDLLRSEGHEVVTVADGRALLEYLGASMVLGGRPLPDVIVTDLRMPGMTGMQLLEGVRDRGWRLPVVVISAFGDGETRARAHALGAAAFLDKPIEATQLKRVLQASLAH